MSDIWGRVEYSVLLRIECSVHCPRFGVYPEGAVSFSRYIKHPGSVANSNQQNTWSSCFLWLSAWHLLNTDARNKKQSFTFFSIKLASVKHWTNAICWIWHKFVMKAFKEILTWNSTRKSIICAVWLVQSTLIGNKNGDFGYVFRRKYSVFRQKKTTTLYLLTLSGSQKLFPVTSAALKWNKVKIQLFWFYALTVESVSLWDFFCRKWCST